MLFFIVSSHAVVNQLHLSKFVHCPSRLTNLKYCEFEIKAVPADDNDDDHDDNGDIDNNDKS